MTPAERDRLGQPILFLYWAMLFAGLVMFVLIRHIVDDAMAQLWIGAIGGTAIGTMLALRDYRLWVAVLAILAVAAMFVTHALVGAALWMTFVPAVLCGYWSLGDRGSLVAFWFPAMIWMQSILDRTHGTAVGDGSGIALLGLLALIFVIYLRIRETRRITMWTAIATTPIATARPAKVLREAPGRHFVRAAWWLVVGSITFAITAWVAPYLWHTESFGDGQIEVAIEPPPTIGLPCCPAKRTYEATESRVKEYLDLGRGHPDDDIPLRENIDCQICDGTEPPAVIAGVGAYGTCDAVSGVGMLYRAPYATTGGTWAGGGGAGAVARAPVASLAPVIGPSYDPPRETPRPQPPVEPAIQPMPPPPQQQPPPVVAPPEPLPPPPAVATVEPPPVTPPPAVEPAPVAEVPSVAPTRAPAPPPAVAKPPPHANAAHPRRASGGPDILHWIAVIVAVALLLQIVALVLRPFRRAIALRHLRRPFWDETVDQRISNSWQLALVGLRDAGWRPASDETPREFAQRVGAGELERCATILDRARHGIGVTDADLVDMATAADATYHASRRGLGVRGRVGGQLRWPLA